MPPRIHHFQRHEPDGLASRVEEEEDEKEEPEDACAAVPTRTHSLGNTDCLNSYGQT